MWATYEGIRRNLTPDGRTPGADRYLGAGQGRQREGKWTRDVSHRLARRTPCSRPEMERSVDKQWRPAGGGAIQVYVRFVPWRAQ